MNDAGYDVEPFEMDLSSRDSILAIIAKAQEYGEIKYLVNAAGEIRMVSFMNKAGKRLGALFLMLVMVICIAVYGLGKTTEI